VDYEHIKNCDCIKPTNRKVTDIILPLNEVTSIWDIVVKILQTLKKGLKELNNKINKLYDA